MPERNPTHASENGVLLVNWSRLEEIREYDPKGVLVRKVVGSFVREGKSRIAAIARAAGSRDAPALASAAHALKGAASNVGAAVIAELCAALEVWGGENRLEQAEATAALLRQRFAETARALEKNFPLQERRISAGARRRRATKRRQGASRRHGRGGRAGSRRTTTA
jgi:HPt (histidine-containing phosphotransfer) domain-containing protein